MEAVPDTPNLCRGWGDGGSPPPQEAPPGQLQHLELQSSPPWLGGEDPAGGGAVPQGETEAGGRCTALPWGLQGAVPPGRHYGAGVGVWGARLWPQHPGKSGGALSTEQTLHGASEDGAALGTVCISVYRNKYVC